MPMFFLACQAACEDTEKRIRELGEGNSDGLAALMRRNVGEVRHKLNAAAQICCMPGQQAEFTSRVHLRRCTPSLAPVEA